ncbi:ferredoxin reductase family protein [Breoghania sp. L-A4]|uniref:ferredoxin reductase family protein n=1 Tax=Breoghania sp. L-A4 TaxID=2304600 RepID=UPI000E35896E|nr:ferredoxin reductase family protein [Breoghania sp. L-A4]AXS41720.1 hypothetical protein D1F64_19055 [Breoghania sp. L-A4]
MPSFVLIPVYIALMITPLVLSFGQDLPARGLRNDLASGLALVAFTILLVEFVLSGRFRVISRRIGSDVSMRWHQLLARGAIVLAVAHPFLYSAPYAPARPWDPTRAETLLMRADYLLAGTLALALLVPFVLTAIYRDQLSYRYETWRRMHGIGAGLIVGLVAVHALIGGRYSAQGPLAAYWVALLAIAAASLLFVYALKPLSQLRHRYRVASLERIAERTWEVVLEPDGGEAMTFRAGQFVWLNIGHSPFSLDENPFSIATAPGDRPRIGFLIKEVGDFTRSLGAVEPATHAYIDGPHGHLTIDGRQADGIALIAGGVGLAPLMSIARQMRHDGDSRPVVLVYGNRTAEQIAYRAELDDMSRAMDMRVEHVLSEPPEGWSGRTGMIDEPQLAAIFGGRPDPRWLYVLCGPPGMLRAAENALRGLGVAPNRILSERFVYD